VYKQLQSRRRTRITIDPFITSKLSLVSSDNIQQLIDKLSSFHNRHSKSQYIESVANWLKMELINVGYNSSAINFHNYSEAGFNLKNIVCDKKGTTDKTILLCAHYDTILNRDIDDGQTGVVSTNNEASQDFGLTMKGLAETYTDLSIEFDPIDASDYMPFEARGYVCVGAYDGAAKPSNPHYHSDTDVITNLDMVFLTNVTKMVLAFVLSEAV
jgi:hypothetical protein